MITVYENLKDHDSREPRAVGFIRVFDRNSFAQWAIKQFYKSLYYSFLTTKSVHLIDVLLVRYMRYNQANTMSVCAAYTWDL